MNIYVSMYDSLKLKKSIICVLVKDCSKDKYFTLMVDPMLDQVQIDGNGNLYSIYESNAAIYCDGNKDDDFKVIDFNRLLKK